LRLESWYTYKRSKLETYKSIESVGGLPISEYNIKFDEETMMQDSVLRCYIEYYKQNIEIEHQEENGNDLG
jgi:hypothetical protein